MRTSRKDNVKGTKHDLLEEEMCFQKSIGNATVDKYGKILNKTSLRFARRPPLWSEPLAVATHYIYNNIAKRLVKWWQ